MLPKTRAVAGVLQVNRAAHVDEMEIQHFLLVALFCCMPNASTSLFEWLFGKNEDGMETTSSKTPGMKFELSTGDPRFLQLKDVLDKMSPLDACYNIVSILVRFRCNLTKPSTYTIQEVQSSPLTLRGP